MSSAAGGTPRRAGAGSSDRGLACPGKRYTRLGRRGGVRRTAQMAPVLGTREGGQQRLARFGVRGEGDGGLGSDEIEIGPQGRLRPLERLRFVGEWRARARQRPQLL